LYLDNSELVFEEENLYTVGPVGVDPTATLVAKSFSSGFAH
jgi:hypothetical protein